MSDYIAYRDDKNITNGQFIEALHNKYEKFTKIQSTFISYPDKYGLCLTPEAEDVLVKEFGVGPGLVHYKKRKHSQKRRKNNRMEVRLPDEMYVRVVSMMHSLGFTTVQEFLETTLAVMLEREDGTNESG